MNLPIQKPGSSQDNSWPLLLTIAAVMVGSLSLLQYNVIYTEGEVMQGLFTLLIGLVAACALIGFYRRKVAVWCVVLFGGSLLLWQAYQIRQWALIHEDVVAIVRFAEDLKTKTGHYPSDLEGYVFKNPQVKTHIYRLSLDEAQGFRISYFMNQPGITYWYSSKEGFNYYPD